MIRVIGGGTPPVEQPDQPMGGWVRSGAFAPSGRELLVTSQNHTLLWNVDRAVMIRQGSGLKRIDAHTFSDQLVAMGSEILESGARADLKAKLPRTSGNDVSFSALSSDGARIVTVVTADSAARVWSTENGRLQAILEGHTGTVLSATFTPDGRRVVTASADGTARVWDLRPDLSVDSMATGTKATRLVTVSPDGHRVVSVSEAGEAVVWTPGRNAVVRLDGTLLTLRPPVFSANGTRLVAAGEGDVARMWNADTGATVTEYRGHVGAVRSVALSPDGALVATGGEDGTVRLWDATTGALRRRLDGHIARVGTVQFSPDGTRIVSSGVGVDSQDDKRGLMWSPAGAPLMPLGGTVQEIEPGAFSPDGNMIVGEGEGGEATMWDARSGAILRTFPATRILGIHATFSPDGRRIVTTDDDGAVRLWDAQRPFAKSDPKPQAFRADSGEADEARFSPDGTRLISYGRNQDLRLWDVASRESLVTFAGQRGGEGQAAFMPDGMRFVAASGSRLNVYPATVAQFLLRGCDMLRHRSAFAQVEAACPPPRRDGERTTEASSSPSAR